MNVLRELFDLLPGDSIDKRGFTDTVTPDQTILAALDELEHSILKQCLTTNDQGQVVDQDITLERVGLVVDHCGRWDALLVLNEFLDFLVKSILHPFFLLCFLLHSERILLLCVVVPFCLLSI